jgi:serine phosphatase RsbU (regulator of sigma subunit)
VTPVRLKKILILLLKILIVVELATALGEGLSSQQWGRFGVDLVVAGVLYLTWGKFAVGLAEKREAYRAKMVESPDAIRLFDALIFSLLWSDRIYDNIPKDRLRLIVIAYTLIALGLVAAFVKFGTGFMPLVVSGALVLGAVNLVTWIVSLEREAKESLQTELRLARDVQMALMPKDDPKITGFEIAGTSIPAATVGGDLFDYTGLGEDGSRLGIAVCDVSGKGMQAAMSAVFTSGAFASEAGRSASPGCILSRLNTAIYHHSRKGQFVTFLLGALDKKKHTLTFANAGQTKPLLLSGGNYTWIDLDGVRFPLGMREASTYSERTITLKRGDVVFMLTDGFTEAMDDREEVFGSERIEASLRTADVGMFSARQIIDHLTGTVKTYAGDTPQHDDMTIVVIKVV